MPATTHDDPALETLMLPFATGLLQWPASGTLFLRAREGWALRQQSIPQLVCEQTFRPAAQALEHAGFTLAKDASESSGHYSNILVLPPRQRDESRALLARAVASVAPGGTVVASLRNDEGARSIEKDLAQLTGGVQTLTKNKCRVFWSTPSPAAQQSSLVAQWCELEAIRPIVDGRFLSRPGLFAWDRIDAGSQLLAESLSPQLRGIAADLGAGFGYLSAALLERCPNVTALDLYEAEARALELARLNLASAAQQKTLGFHWHDVATGLPRQYDVIVTNPPFHAQGRADRNDLGQKFITVAAQSLRPGGSLWLVANRHLPYEAILQQHFNEVRAVAERAGFKVVAAIKAGRA